MAAVQSFKMLLGKDAFVAKQCSYKLHQQGLTGAHNHLKYSQDTDSYFNWQPKKEWKVKNKK